MKAVLLVGGLGTRLRPLTFSIPKPLLPVGEKPILQIIIERLRRADINEIILATGYQAELLETFCGNGSKFGVSISYVREPEPLGTAGPLSLMRTRFAADEHFLMMNGDILTDLDFRLFMAASRDKGYDLMVGYTHHTYRCPFGVLTLNDGLVKGIVEKPSQEFAISAGIYAVRSSALAFVPDRKFFTVPDLMHKLTDVGKAVGAYHISNCWLGLESITQFEEACKELSNAPQEEAITT